MVAAGVHVYLVYMNTENKGQTNSKQISEDNMYLLFALNALPKTSKYSVTIR